jgi:hypothetical protein
MSLEDQKALMIRNLAFAVARGGASLTCNGITGVAVVSSSDKSENNDEIGTMIRRGLSATLPVSTWATAPVVGETFITGGVTYRIESVTKTHAGHAWIISGQDHTQ